MAVNYPLSSSYSKHYGVEKRHDDSQATLRDPRTGSSIHQGRRYGISSCHGTTPYHRPNKHPECFRETGARCCITPATKTPLELAEIILTSAEPSPDELIKLMMSLIKKGDIQTLFDISTMKKSYNVSFPNPIHISRFIGMVKACRIEINFKAGHRQYNQLSPDEKLIYIERFQMVKEQYQQALMNLEHLDKQFTAKIIRFEKKSSHNSLKHLIKQCSDKIFGPNSTSSYSFS